MQASCQAHADLMPTLGSRDSRGQQGSAGGRRRQQGAARGSREVLAGVGGQGAWSVGVGLVGGGGNMEGEM